MQIRPLYDRIVVKRIIAETRSKSGLFLPESAEEPYHEGEVVAVGHGRLDKNGELQALTVKLGDRILFGRYAGDKVQIDGEDRVVLREDNVFGIVGA